MFAILSVKGESGIDSSPRSRRTALLNLLPELHTQPHNGVIYSRPYGIIPWEVLS
jgi:hypothetical protein